MTALELTPPPMPVSIERTMLRRRIAAIEDGLEGIDAAYHADIMNLLDDSTSVRLGDVLRMPDGPENDVEIVPWEAVFILRALVEKMRERLKALERAGARNTGV